ncbi:hypothetical protein BAY60_05055 [Prauserella muralis]|uniref:Anti-sigma factor antagonist n=1 Tax=Prauserella muralis TaxID=588067 RepID=A0A2V4BBT9_9PSEU|nr:hypothetical protein BAY60_05055 [Prauserella muralis]
MQLHVRVDGRHPGCVVVVLDGEVDLQTVDQLSAALETQLARKPALLIVDLSAVGFLGAAGLSALLDASRAGLDHGTELRLVAGRRRVVRRIVDLCGLTTALPVYRDVTEAVVPSPTDTAG